MPSALKLSKGALPELESNFSQLTLFFGKISIMLKDGLKPNVDRLLKTLSASSPDRLGGVTMSGRAFGASIELVLRLT